MRGRAPGNRSQVGHVGAFFWSSWLQVGGLRANLAPSWGSWGQLGSKSGVLGPTWLQVGSKLGPSWAQVGPSWAQAGAKLASWCQVGGKLGQVGAMWIFQDFWRESGREGMRHFRNNYAFWALVHTKQQLAVEYKQQLRNCRI